MENYKSEPLNQVNLVQSIENVISMKTVSRGYAFMNMTFDFFTFDRTLSPMQNMSESRPIVIEIFIHHSKRRCTTFIQLYVALIRRKFQRSFNGSKNVFIFSDPAHNEGEFLYLCLLLRSQSFQMKLYLEYNKLCLAGFQSSILRLLYFPNWSIIHGTTNFNFIQLLVLCYEQYLNENPENNRRKKACSPVLTILHLHSVLLQTLQFWGVSYETYIEQFTKLTCYLYLVKRFKIVIPVRFVLQNWKTL